MSFVYFTPDGIHIYDGTKVYHAAIVERLNTTRAVSGVANIHTRFGMNSSFFLLAVLIDVGALNHYSGFILRYALYEFVLYYRKKEGEYIEGILLLGFAMAIGVFSYLVYERLRGGDGCALCPCYI